MSWNTNFSEALVKVAMVRPAAAKMLAKMLLVVVAKRDRGSATPATIRQTLDKARLAAKKLKKKKK